MHVCDSSLMLRQFEGPRADVLFALVVEDDLDAGDIFEFALRAGGFVTSVVKSGAEALAWLASIVPDIIVLDLHLPDLPGTEVLRHIRTNSRLAKIPVIVATAYPETVESVEDEADLVLVKPVRYNVLQDKAVELVGTLRR